MTEPSAGIPATPLAAPQPKSQWDNCITKNGCAVLAIGSILAALGFTLLFYSPLNLATSAGFAKCLVGSVLAATGSLLIIYKVFVNCSAGSREVRQEVETPKTTEELAEELVKAITDAHIATVESLLRQERLDLNYIDRRGFAPLHYAARWLNPTIIELLASKGATIDIESKEDENKGFPGQTPLHCALYIPALKGNVKGWIAEGRQIGDLVYQSKRLQTVQALLKWGASPNSKVDELGTPIELARSFNYTEIVAELEKSCAK